MNPTHNSTARPKDNDSARPTSILKDRIGQGLWFSQRFLQYRLRRVVVAVLAIGIGLACMLAACGVGFLLFQLAGIVVPAGSEGFAPLIATIGGTFVFGGLIAARGIGGAVPMRHAVVDMLLIVLFAGACLALIIMQADHNMNPRPTSVPPTVAQRAGEGNRAEKFCPHLRPNKSRSAAGTLSVGERPASLAGAAS